MMLRWNALHPYNAVHVVRVAGALDPDRLKSAIASTLQSISFKEIVLNAANDPSSSTHFDARNIFDRLPDISILPPNDSSVLHSHIQRELNRGFLCGPRVNPFRFFVQIVDPSFWFGLTYFHPVADAEAIVWLLRLCVEAYFDREGVISPSPPREERRPLMLEISAKIPGPFLLRY